jgi:hypothetical protein
MKKHEAPCKRYMGNEVDGSSRGPLQQLEGLRIYRVSREECKKIRESVPYVKYTDITQNTYIQS